MNNAVELISELTREKGANIENKYITHETVEKGIKYIPTLKDCNEGFNGWEGTEHHCEVKSPPFCAVGTKRLLL